MKQTIRLTESQLKKVITETIKNVLREQDEDAINFKISDYYKDNNIDEDVISMLLDDRFNFMEKICHLLQINYDSIKNLTPYNDVNKYLKFISIINKNLIKILNDSDIIKRLLEINVVMFDDIFKYLTDDNRRKFINTIMLDDLLNSQHGTEIFDETWVKYLTPQNLRLYDKKMKERSDYFIEN